MAMTQEQLEYQRAYRARTGYAASKKYAVSDKGKKTIKRGIISLKKRINSDFDAFVAYSVRSLRSGARTRNLAFNLTKLISNKEKFSAKYGKEDIESKIESVYFSCQAKFLSRNLNEELYNANKAKILAQNNDQAKRIYLRSQSILIGIAI